MNDGVNTGTGTAQGAGQGAGQAGATTADPTQTAQDPNAGSGAGQGTGQGDGQGSGAPSGGQFRTPLPNGAQPPAGQANGQGTGEGAGTGTGTPAAGLNAMLSQDMAAALQPKGFQTAEDLARAYVNLEGKVGQKGVIPPREDAPAEEWGNFFAELGRPATPQDYKITLPDGYQPTDLDKTFDGKMREAFHQAGLTPKQAEVINQAHNAFYAETSAAAQQAATQGKERMDAELAREYGDQLQSKVALGQQAIKHLGADQETVDALGRALGSDAKLMKFAIGLGEKMAEDGTFRTMPGGGLVTTAGGAQQELNKLKGYKEFQAALTDRAHPEHREAVTRWGDLQRMAGAAAGAGQ